MALSLEPLPGLGQDTVRHWTGEPPHQHSPSDPQATGLGLGGPPGIPVQVSEFFLAKLKTVRGLEPEMSEPLWTPLAPAVDPSSDLPSAPEAELCPPRGAHGVLMRLCWGPCIDLVMGVSAAVLSPDGSGICMR